MIERSLFFMEILVAHLDSKNRPKRLLENSSFLVRVATYFLVPHEEFKTEKILLPTLNHSITYFSTGFLISFCFSALIHFKWIEINM